MALPTSTVTVRPAGPDDLPRLLALRLAEAERRAALEPDLWPLGDLEDLQGRLLAELERDLTQPERRAWFLAEQGGLPVGLAEAGRYPAPPIIRDQVVGIVGPDLHAVTTEALNALLDAAETYEAAGGVVARNAACPARDAPTLEVLTARGYRPLTQWMIAPVNAKAPYPDTVRPATGADLPEIVRLHALARANHFRANPRFWPPHPQAAERFMAWMQRSLTLDDRDMLVHERAGQVRGFVIAQPWPEPSVGLIDDLAADSWDVAAELLTAVHHAFAARGRRTVQVICPAGWREKSEFLQALGYRTANLWLMRDE